MKKYGEGEGFMGSATAIPYEAQSDPQSSRTCGAACLAMVYRSLGKDVSQATIWPAIAKPNRFGSLASTVHLMVRDALGRGFSALAIQSRHTSQALRVCRESGIRTIMNHRLKPDSRAGHFTVLVDVDDETVLLHDPLLGPSRRLSHAQLQELWQSRFPDSEIVGNIVIGIADQPRAMAACQFCRTAMASSVECPRCEKPVLLQPAELLGCLNNACIARIWNYICCPACDYLWSFDLQPGQTAAAVANSPTPLVSAQAASSPAAGLDVNKLFGEIDRFCAHILTIPALANHAEIKKQLDFITVSKEKFTLAHEEQLARRARVHAQLAEATKKVQEQKEAHRKKMEELNRVAPPLDGNALGHALLKNLGFKS